MKYGEFRGNFQKIASIFISRLYTMLQSHQKSQSQKGYYGSGRNRIKMVTTAPFFVPGFQRVIKSQLITQNGLPGLILHPFRPRFAAKRTRLDS